MSFLSGSVSCQRFAASRDTPFGEGNIEALRNFSINITAPDAAGEAGEQAGWAGGRHKYDGELSAEKNLRGEYLCWSFRLSRDKPPADEVKAAYQIELAARVEAGKKPTAKQKRESREAAQAVVEEKGRDGRWVKYTLIPVVWDAKTGQVWFGTASHTHAGAFADLFRRTFGVELVSITPHNLADFPEPSQNPGFYEPAFSSEIPCWISDSDTLDWLGNEFALWLLWTFDTIGGPIADLTVVPLNRLTLACPDGLNGSDTFVTVLPLKLPEVMRAFEAGRMPRDFGLSVSRAGEDGTTLTLQPERWAVTGAKLPEDEDGPSEGEQAEVARLDRCRALFAALDSLMTDFLTVRSGDWWEETVSRIQQWIGRVPAEVG